MLCLVIVTAKLFTELGYPPIEAMDFTDAEGAQHIHDLNTPCPPELRGQFDLVIDGGTTEHIFHIGTALDTCHALLAPGGIFMSFVSCDGWFGHGFFQTGPDVPWRYWHHARGYEMLEVSIVPRKSPLRITPIPIRQVAHVAVNSRCPVRIFWSMPAAVRPAIRPFRHRSRDIT